MRWLARAITVSPVSSGWRSASSTPGWNSGSSSRNRTPRCASYTSPGRGAMPPRPAPPCWRNGAVRGMGAASPASRPQLAGEASAPSRLRAFPPATVAAGSTAGAPPASICRRRYVIQRAMVKPRAYSFCVSAPPSSGEGTAPSPKGAGGTLRGSRRAGAGRCSFQDLGVSAFRGKNAASGMLRTFLEAVEEGTIARGGYFSSSPWIASQGRPRAKRSASWKIS